jgi:hypothetical protein
MTALDSSSLKLWESVGLWGFVFVWVGVAGEGAEIIAKLRFKESFKRHEHSWDICSGICWLILVVALAVEFIGNVNAMRIADRENTRLDGLASAANERAANIESNNIVLQAKMLPRRITPTQTEAFLRLLNSAPKGNITIGCRHPDNESINFMEQISSLLLESGFTIDAKVEYPNNTVKFHTGDSIALFIDRLDNMPNYAIPLMGAFNSIGIKAGWVTNMVNSPDDPLFGRINTPNRAMLFIIEKQ